MSWVGMARTNFFPVRDEPAFRAWAQELELVVIADEHNRFGVYSKTDDGGFPTSARGDDEIDFALELSRHLQPGSIAILMEIGNDKARYVSGFAIGVNSEGKRICIDLGDIYSEAGKFFGVEENSITKASY